MQTLTTNLDKIFRPSSVVVFGASRNAGKVGHMALRNIVQSGFGGPVHAVNPKYDSVLDVKCFDSIDEIEGPVDLAVICTPARTVPEIIRQCGDFGVGGVVIITAGFGETGEDGRQLQQNVKEVADRYPEMRVIGPNCVGVVAPHAGLNASFARGMPRAGHLAFISQSGALCTAVLDRALLEDIGFSAFVSIGNTMDLSAGELIDYFAADPNTKALVMYVESISNGPEFLSAASRFARQKPFIACKSGRFRQSAAAAASHTGAMAGADAVFEAAFKRAGINRVFSIEEMFDCAECLARSISPAGDRLAIVTNAGGPGVMATDALIERNGTLATLEPKTIEALDAMLPDNWSGQNPVDVIGDATPARLAGAMQIVIDDPGVDAVLVMTAPQAMTDPLSCAEALVGIATAADVPVLASWIGGVSMGEAVEHLNEHGIPTLPTPERAVKAFMHLVEYAQNRKRLETAPPLSPVDSPYRTPVREKHPAIFAQHEGLVNELDAKSIADGYGIETVESRLAESKEDAVRIAAEIGFPVVLKIVSPEISHKTDVGGVKLDLQDASAVADAYCQIVANARRHLPSRIISGVTVQPMIDLSAGVELIVGAKRDPVFGPVLMVGAGGVNAEIFHDVAFELPPLNDSLAMNMLKSLKSWRLLDGYRGRPEVDINKVVDALIKVSWLVTDNPEISELDINPLLTTADRAVALDARIIIKQASDSLPEHSNTSCMSSGT